VTVGASGANGNNQSEASLLSVHSDFNYWDNIVNLGVGSGIYLGGNGSGAGYVLTANHLLNLTPGSSSISIAGSSYGVTNSSRIGTTDLRLFTVDGASGLPNLPNVVYGSQGPSIGEEIIQTGRGSRIQGTDNNPFTSDTVNRNGFQVYEWGNSGNLSWGLNEVSPVLPWLGSGGSASWTSGIGATEVSFFSNFSDPGAGNYDSSYEGAFSAGDSGGPAFIQRNGVWELAGINSTVLTRGSQPSNTTAFGNYASYVSVADYIDQLPQLAAFSVSSNVPEPSTSLLITLAVLGTASLRRRDSKVS